ncbi:uncharacterized protein LOC100374545 [Saccoglossus kowalevskii]
MISHILIVAGCLAVVSAQDLWVDKVEITSPDSVTYSTEAPTNITFSIWIGNKDPEVHGELTGIQVYFTNGSNYEDASVKSEAIEVAIIESPRSVEAGEDESVEYGGNTASIVVDAAQCEQYTNVCFLIQHPGSTGESTDLAEDDDACLALGDNQPGGVLTCPEPDIETSDDDKDNHASHSGVNALLCLVSMSVFVFAYMK